MFALGSGGGGGGLIANAFRLVMTRYGLLGGAPLTADDGDVAGAAPAVESEVTAPAVAVDAINPAARRGCHENSDRREIDRMVVKHPGAQIVARGFEKILGLFIQIPHQQCRCIRTVTSSDVQNRSEWCEALYEAEAAKLILYGRALGLDHAEAEDIVQEVFIALLALEELPAKPSHYLVRAVRNRAFSYRRSLWRRCLREWESHSWFEPGSGKEPGEAAAVACLEKLPPDQREVIVLKIWHHHTFEEIGSLLQKSPNTVAGRYRYGLERLRTCLNSQSINSTSDAEHTAYEPDRPAARSLDRPIVLLDAAPR